MATLRECIDELRARRARLEEAQVNGWGDVVPDEQESVREFESAFHGMVEANAEALLAAAGDVELGPLPVGVGLGYSEE